MSQFERSLERAATVEACVHETALVCVCKCGADVRLTILVSADEIVTRLEHEPPMAACKAYWECGDSIDAWRAYIGSLRRKGNT